MKTILCAATVLLLFSCKRYTCECTTENQQSRKDDAYQVSAPDKSEALSKCQSKHNKTSIGSKKAYCVIK